MKNFMLAAVGAIALSISASAVSAADMGMAYDWSGPYVGLQGGLSNGNVDYDIPAYAPFPPDGDVSGFVFGAYAGYNMQMSDSFVLGAELGGNWRSVDGSDLTVASPGEVFVTDQKWDASFVAHLGMPMDNFMFYGLAGLAVTKISGNYENPLAATVAPSASDTVAGWTVGAGVDAVITENVRGRIEYRYADYGSADLTCSLCGPTAVDLTTHTLTGGISFNW
jgi:outer membrane immunogenic protein